METESVQLSSLKEGDVVPLEYNETKVEAEIYTIKNDKILLRHEKWEWIDKNSKRLYPVNYTHNIHI